MFYFAQPCNKDNTGRMHNILLPRECNEGAGLGGCGMVHFLQECNEGAGLGGCGMVHFLQECNEGAGLGGCGMVHFLQECNEGAGLGGCGMVHFLQERNEYLVSKLRWIHLVLDLADWEVFNWSVS